jgi:hypothetical protein
MARLAPTAALLLAAATLAGCAPTFSGELVLDQVPISPTGCRSGEHYGYRGVELDAADGSRLRLVAQPDGSVEAFWFPPGGRLGDHLGACGAMETERQPARVNGVHGVDGHAELACASGTHALVGALRFDNCF